ncbi:hypothetical protein JOL62DRAFT_398961 [Phyllosticta paracitricarpa]|uniref:Uncharacterized protein n=1 Tax=Phyllosticta paracitricarpa TaxID=2016321 RepID=A0ABR1MS55_9PEZI
MNSAREKQSVGVVESAPNGYGRPLFTGSRTGMVDFLICSLSSPSLSLSFPSHSSPFFFFPFFCWRRWKGKLLGIPAHPSTTASVTLHDPTYLPSYISTWLSVAFIHMHRQKRHHSTTPHQIARHTQTGTGRLPSCNVLKLRFTQNVSHCLFACMSGVQRSRPVVLLLLLLILYNTTQHTHTTPARAIITTSANLLAVATAKIISTRATTTTTAAATPTFHFLYIKQTRNGGIRRKLYVHG